MLEKPAIQLEHVSKSYRLYGSQHEQMMDVLGLNRLFGRPKQQAREFKALDDISLTVPRGHRIGIIGRNGAGKTTLLKLIGGNFAPSSGTIEVNGTLQALMNVGVGFHPEFTGTENVRAALQYNGLPKNEFEAAMADVIDFCELGEFIDQPFKTYSLGMQARLMFATATAIHPDILIIDEVLGAGDAYFITKSRKRMEKLVRSGATMLLVSHSTSQVLELCQEAIWLEQGKIRMQGDAFLVVKAYEEFMHGPRASLIANLVKAQDEAPPLPARTKVTELPAALSVPRAAMQNRQPGAQFLLQDPPFLSHLEAPAMPALTVEDATEMRHQAKGGLCRLESDVGLKLCGLSIVSARGIGNTLTTLEPAKVVLHLKAEISGDFACRYGIVIDDLQGRTMARIFSPADRFSIKQGEIRRVEILLNPLQLGPGDYLLGLSVFEYTPLELVNQARRYDLVGWSFTFRVELPGSLATANAAFFHSAEWQFETMADQAAHEDKDVA